MKTHLLTIIFILSTSMACAISAIDGKKRTWHGFDRVDFKIEGRRALVVSPKQPRSDRAWVLRPAFPEAFPKADIELLKNGFYIAHFDTTHDYANLESRRLMDKFFNFMTKRHGFNNKVALEGLSRGGAFALMWANDDPSKLACVYVDNPVCDFREWPVKKQPNLIDDFRKKWNLKEGEEKNFNNSPIDNLEKLAKSGVPVLMIVGDRDNTVPFATNGKVYQDRFFDNGGALSLIIRQGANHHPHGLNNPAPIVDFIKQAYNPEKIDRKSDEYRKFEFIKNRDGITNALKVFAQNKCGTVAFVGGSITEMHGWKEMVCTSLQKRFPKTKFNFICVGISSLGTIPHAFRLRHDIPNLKDVDLMFVEGTVNDDSDDPYDLIAQMGAFSVEGIVRQALNANPQMDIVQLHFIYDGFFKTLEKGETPAIVKRHEQIAEHYKLPSIDYTAEIWARMQDKQFDWDTFGGTHPSPFGHRYYARAIENLFDMNSTSGKISKKALPKKFCQNPLENGRYVDVSNAKIKNGWYVEKNWQKKSKAYVRPRFKNLEILETRNSGAEFEFEFEGNTIGIYILAGEEAGILEYSIDGSPFKKFDTYTKYSHRLFLPSVAVFSNTLSEGKHKITIRMSEQKNPKSLGNACQIIKFAVNSK